MEDKTCAVEMRDRAGESGEMAQHALSQLTQDTVAVPNEQTNERTNERKKHVAAEGHSHAPLWMASV